MLSRLWIVETGILDDPDTARKVEAWGAR